MSKIITPEELQLVEGEFPFESCATHEVVDALLKAQRDSSDREWIKLVESYMRDMTGTLGNPEGNRFVVISEKDWQALKKEHTNEQ